ncbi:MAG: MFS transporter [Clostridiaceae bacterium]|jgi:Na+/melibiose symporter-like transporter|nr:MFS transporter [Clostridiaceae bacterium]
MNDELKNYTSAEASDAPTAIFSQESSGAILQDAMLQPALQSQDADAPSAAYTEEPVRPEDKIPLKEKLIYGAADLFGGGHGTILSIILLYFFTDIIGIGAALAGTVFLLSKIWDAVIDPLLGSVSDNMRGRFGRRKPFMLIGGLLIIPAYAFLFAPIQNLPSSAAKAAFATIAYLAYSTVASTSQVPFMSMSSDISSDYRERNRANLVKLVFDMASAGVCFLLPSALIDALSNGTISQTTFYLAIVLGFGIVFSAPLILAAFVVKERTPIPSEKTKFDIKEWLRSFRVKSYRYHIIMYLSAFLCMDIVTALALYYVNNVLKDVVLFGNKIGSVFVIAPMMVLAAAVVPLCYLGMKKKSKQFAYRIGLPLYVIGAVMLACFVPGKFLAILVPIFACIMGIGLGGAQMMPWLIFPDTVDVAELKLKYRPTGAFSGMMTFARTASTAVAIQIIGLVLGWTGYQSSTADTVVTQPNSVLLAIRLMLGISVAVLITIAFLTSFKYKVTDKKLARVRYFNDAEQKGLTDGLSSEELLEKQALIDELA